MSVRSDRFAAGTFECNASGYVDLYTVPADRTAIVKDVRGWQFTGPSALALVWQSPAGDVADIGQTPDDSGPFAFSDPPPWCVGREGDVLRMYGPVGADFRINVSGALLAGDPA